MPLQINNLQELQDLIASTDVEIRNVEELQELLRTVNRTEVSPEVHQEELAARERLQEREHAHQKSLRQLEHVERMRALELGWPLPDPAATEAGASMAAGTVEAAGWIGVLTPLTTFGAAVGATYLLLRYMEELPAQLFIAALGILWGTSAIVGLLGVVLAFGTIRKRTLLDRRGKPASTHGETPVGGRGETETSVRPVEVGA